MAPVVPVSTDVVRQVELLVRSGHALLLVDSGEHERVRAILEQLGERLRLPFYEWQAHAGLAPRGMRAASSAAAGDATRPSHEPTLEPLDDGLELEGGVAGTTDPERCLEWLARHGHAALVFLPGMLHYLDDKKLVARVRSLHAVLGGTPGALVFTGDDAEPPGELSRLFTRVALAPLTATEYQQYISAVLRDLRGRMPLEVALRPDEVAVLLDQVRGLTLAEVRQVVTQAIVEDGRLDVADLDTIREAKRGILGQSGVLELQAAERALSEVAGLATLKVWLAKRKRAFTEPQSARAFGVPPPKGILLVGVQGCGKSLAARAVACDWALPLVRLDPSNLYDKFVGQSEKNLQRAIRTAEAMAPVVLWIDEIEKAFASASAEGSADAGLSQRIFGTFLTWLNDKQDGVFVVATANDVSRLPPELVRKGRFDEIFFVDLPEAPARAELFALHLARRQRDPAGFGLEALVARSEGFSGAEIEQVVVAALYSAFADGRDLDTATLLAELAATRPLATTMAERVAALRAWASDRAVRAD